MCGHMFWSSMSCNFVSDSIADSLCVTMLMKEVLGVNVEMMILSVTESPMHRVSSPRPLFAEDIEVLCSRTSRKL